MKKVVAAGLTAAMLLAGMPVAGAAADPVATLQEAFEAFQTEVTVKTDDAVGTLQQMFTQNPKLFYYFEGYSATMSKNGKKTTYTLTYHNTDVPQDTIFVATSQSDLYNVVGYALINLADSVPVVLTDSTMNEDSIIGAIDDLHADNYLAYMGYQGVNATGYSSTESSLSTWSGFTLDFLYIEDTATIQEWRQQTEDKVIELAGTLFALDMPDWEKELVIHDYIVGNTTYDQAAESSSEYDSAHTAYGALVEGSAVCEGYAEAANLLFHAAGLSAQYVEGAGDSSNHAWNVVEIDGENYWVDLTWDDPVPEGGGSETISHKYFNLTDSELNEDHSWQSAQYPACTSTTWSYSNVQSALDEITDDNGNVTEVYSNYSAENVKKLADLSSDLAYALGVDETAFATANGEATTETQAVTETATAETTAAEAEGESHILRNILIVLLVLLVLLVVAYLIYRRIMYLRMLERKKKRAAARRRQQARQGQDTSMRTASTGDRPRSGRSSQRPRSGDGQSRSGSRSGSRPRRNNPYR